MYLIHSAQISLHAGTQAGCIVARSWLLTSKQELEPRIEARILIEIDEFCQFLAMFWGVSLLNVNCKSAVIDNRLTE